MTVKDVKQRQADLTPKEDLRPYAGQWVALRNGYVVASDIDPARLRENPEVQTDDVIIPVADAEGGYFL